MNMNLSTKLIVIEGMDLVGKTTLINKLKEKYDFCFTSEPTLQAKEKLLLCEDAEDELLLMLEDRENHCTRLKNETKPILSDRYVLSTLVYQGRLLTEDYILNTMKSYTNILPTTLGILIISDYETYLERLNQRKHDKFDVYSKEEYEHMTNKYIEYANRFNYHILNCNDSELLEKTCKLIDNVL